MKKVKYGALFLALVGIGFTSCEKEEVELDKNAVENSLNDAEKNFELVDNNDYSHLSVINGVLNFSSIEYYESFFDKMVAGKEGFLQEYTAKLNFKSFNSITIARENGEIDDFVASILDENGIVKIGEWFIKLNFETESVYACSDEHWNAYELVQRENDKDVYTFTFDEEVLIYLNDPELLEERGWGCSDRSANRKWSQTAIKNITIINNIQMNMQCKVRYSKYGIYFTLKAEGPHTTEYQPSNTPNRLRYWFQLDNCSYAERCGSSVTNYSHPWKSATSIAGGNSVTTPQYKWYSNSTKLKNFYFRVRLRCEDSGVPSGNNQYTTYFTNYVTIQDY